MWSIDMKNSNMLIIMLVLIWCGCVCAAQGDINIAHYSQGGAYYIGNSMWVAKNPADMESIFNGNSNDSFMGLATSDTGNPGTVYRTWGQEIVLNKINMDCGFVTSSMAWDSGSIVRAEAFYRDPNVGGTPVWNSLGVRTGSYPDGATWDNLGAGNGIITDAIKILTVLGNAAIINDIHAYGPPIVPKILTNIAAKSYLDTHGGTVTGGGTYDGGPNDIIDEDIETIWACHNSSSSDPGLFEINWGQGMLINTIMIAGSGGHTYGVVADIEVYHSGTWHKVESGSSGTSGFEDSFYDGVPNRGWGGMNHDDFGGGEFYGTSLCLGHYVTASKIRLTNFNTNSYLSSGGINFTRELVVYGMPVPTDCTEVWQYGMGDAADVHRDCVVDMLDFAAIAADWLKCNIPGDGNCEENW
jgi:hypothetical protein